MKKIKEAKQKSDIEIAIDNYLESIGVSYSVFGFGAGLKRDGWQCDGWRISLTTQSRPNEPQEFEYFTGIGHRVDYGTGYTFLKGESKNSLSYDNYKRNHIRPFPPFSAGVIYSLLIDSQAGEYSFIDFCSNFGYDNDSRKAESIYFACQEIKAKMQKIFTNEQSSHLQELLQDY